MTKKKNPEDKQKPGPKTKCTDDLLSTAEKYIDEYEDHGDAIPSVVGLALVVDVRRETLHVWAAEGAEERCEDKNKLRISNILGKLKEKQENTLMNGGLKGTFNSNITKLALGKHGYHDKQDMHVKEFHVTIGGKDADTL